MTQQLRLHRRKMLFAVLALAGVAGLVILGRWLHHIWVGDAYPVAYPVVTAHRVDDRTQSVYEVLDLPHAELDADWPGQGTTADGTTCHRRGLRSWGDGLDGHAPSAPHVVDVGTTWALKGLPSAQAEPAIRRIRAALNREGWTVTSYERLGDLLQLRLTHPGTGDTVSVEEYPEQRLEISAWAPCARYPSGTDLSEPGQPEIPMPKAPAQLRE